MTTDGRLLSAISFFQALQYDRLSDRKSVSRCEDKIKVHVFFSQYFLFLLLLFLPFHEHKSDCLREEDFSFRYPLSWAFSVYVPFYFDFFVSGNTRRTSFPSNAFRASFVTLLQFFIYNDISSVFFNRFRRYVHAGPM